MSGNVAWIAADWGTTNRRVYAIDDRGAVTAKLIDDLGVLSIPAGGFPQEVARLRSRFGESPLLLAGMIGSNRGWIEANYLPCPTGLDELAKSIVRVNGANAYIVPGLRNSDRDRPDVMRGEEVQLLGAIAAGMIAPSSGACHPGTHAKWALSKAGAIASIRTVMTGELFALLRAHSILAPQLNAEVTPNRAFIDGVRLAMERRELMTDLFAIRARGLLGLLPDSDAASFASGLLIGTDLGIGFAFVGRIEPLALIGEPRLTSLYAAAAEEAGVTCLQIAGEAAFLAGVKALAEYLR